MVKKVLLTIVVLLMVAAMLWLCITDPGMSLQFKQWW